MSTEGFCIPFCQRHKAPTACWVPRPCGSARRPCPAPSCSGPLCAQQHTPSTSIPLLLRSAGTFAVAWRCGCPGRSKMCEAEVEGWALWTCPSRACTLAPVLLSQCPRRRGQVTFPSWGYYDSCHCHCHCYPNWAAGAGEPSIPARSSLGARPEPIPSTPLPQPAEGG